jgi:hypothetical protein
VSARADVVVACTGSSFGSARGQAAAAGFGVLVAARGPTGGGRRRVHGVRWQWVCGMGGVRKGRAWG